MDPGMKHCQVGDMAVGVVGCAAVDVGQLRNADAADDDDEVKGERGWAGEAAVGGESLASEWNDVMYLQN